MTTTDASPHLEMYRKEKEQGNRQAQIPIDDLCTQIEHSTQLAVETQDYLSFATVLDIALGDPSQFTSEQASAVLTTLYKSLAANPVILYKVGWDLPELLLKYIDRFFAGDVEDLPAQGPFRLVMSLFSLVCEKGNPRELLIRACELMLTTESELNSKRMAMMSLNDTNDEAHQQQRLSESNPTNIDSAHNGFDVWDDTRHENVKFCTLFEVVRFTLQNIETPVPSSFLLEAARTLLQVADDPNADLLSISTYARRIFLLARDFTMKNEDIVSPEEMHRVRQILVNFLSHAADVVVRKYTLKWSERLYVQMKNKVALAPPAERDFFYTETEYTRRMSEVMSRFAQLMLSFDYDPQCAVMSLTDLSDDQFPTTKPDGTCKVPSTKVEGAEVLADNYWSRQILSGPSVVGLSLLNTQLHFDGSRAKTPNWRVIATFTLRLVKNARRSQGLKDLLLYAALWVSNYFETLMPDEPENLDLLHEWLKVLLDLIASSPSPEEQFVTGSVVARALRFQSPDFAYSFCIDIMKHATSSAEQFVAVETLKMLITGKITSPEQLQKYASDASANKVSPASLCTQNACLELSAERRKELTSVSKDAILRLKLATHRLPWYYLNFLAVVPTEPSVIVEICDMLDELSDRCSERSNLTNNCIVEIGLVRRATSQLRESAVKELQQ